MILNTERKSLNYINNSSKYDNKNKDYSKQYCRIYLARLEKMSTLLEPIIKKKWKDYKILKLHKLAENATNEKCVVIGTLFKDQKLKPSVLKQLSDEQQIVAQPIHKHFTHESDLLYVEDELQRYQLLGF